MKCRICGRNFDGDGDICEECLTEESNEQNEGQVNSSGELLKFKRKHLIRYELLSQTYLYVYFIFILSGILSRKILGNGSLYIRNATSYRISTI